MILIAAMGRRWGKTVMAGTWGLTAADFGAAVAWIAPTYRNSRPLWRFAESRVRGTAADVSRSERVISFPSGGWLGIYSGDNPDAMRGESFDLVILDEASRLAEDTWTDAIQPTLADRAGKALLISSPRGKNWFYREWLRGQNGTPGYASFTAPSSANPNPNIKRAAELAKIRVSDRTYRQEWLAEFVDDGGGVFRGVRAVATAEPQAAPIAGHYYVFGVDWGRTNDFTVITVVDTTLRSVVHLDRMTGVDWNTQLSRLEVLAAKFKPYIIYAESNSMGGPLTEELARRNVPVQVFNTTNASKRAVIDALALAFERQDIHIIPDPELLSELDAYEVSTSPSGTVTMSAPSGMHDDCVMSLAIAWQACSQGSAFA